VELTSLFLGYTSWPGISLCAMRRVPIRCSILRPRFAPRDFNPRGSLFRIAISGVAFLLPYVPVAFGLSAFKSGLLFLGAFCGKPEHEDGSTACCAAGFRHCFDRNDDIGLLICSFLCWPRARQ